MQHIVHLASGQVKLSEAHYSFGTSVPSSSLGGLKAGLMGSWVSWPLLQIYGYAKL